MTPTQINELSEAEVIDLMRREGLQIVRSLFATVHFKSESRQDGFSEDDLEEISDDLEDGDMARWRRELAEHFAKKG